MKRRNPRIRRESSDNLFPVVIVGAGVLAWYLLAAKKAAATPSDTWLYTPTAEMGGVTGGTGKSSLSGVATALGLAPAALGVLASVTGLAGKAAGLVSGLFGGGAAVTGVAAFAPGAVPAAYVAADVPFSGTLDLGTQTASFLKDIVSNALFGAGMPSAATAAEMLAQGSVMVSPGVEVGLGFLPATEAATETVAGVVAGISSPWYAWAGPVSAIVAPLIPIIQTITSGYAAEEKAAHEATAANTGVLAQAPYLINWIAAHPFDSSFQMYWQAMNELPEQYAAQKAQFNSAREGMPVPETITRVAEYIPSAADVAFTVEVAELRRQYTAGTPPPPQQAQTPAEGEAYREWQSQVATASTWGGEPGSAAG